MELGVAVWRAMEELALLLALREVFVDKSEKNIKIKRARRTDQSADQCRKEFGRITTGVQGGARIDTS